MSKDKPYVPDRPADYAVVGVDVGKVSDPTVLAVVQPVETWSGRITHRDHDPQWSPCDGCSPELRWRHDVRGMVTLPLGTPYPEQARRIMEVAAAVLERPEVGRVYVPTDATGVGASLVDALREELLERGTERIYVVSVTIGAGEADACSGSFAGGRAWVSATCLMTRLRSKAQAGRIRLTDSGETRKLLDELRTLEFRVGESGRLKFGARPGAHDDRVYALALATLFERQTVQHVASLWA